MRAITVVEYGDPDVLRLVDRPVPVATDHRPVLIRMAATSVNPVELAIRRGLLAARTPNLSLPFTLGFELAGTVLETAGGFTAGQRVAGLLPWLKLGNGEGSNAEIVPAAAEWLTALPDGVDWVTAGSVPLNAQAARQALDNLAGYGPGHTLLVTGASGAVGAFATQFAVRDGLRVFAVASDGDHDFVASLGAERVLARKPVADLVAEARSLVPGGVDAIFDAALLSGELIAAVRDGGSFGTATDAAAPATERGIAVSSVHATPDAERLATILAAVADGGLVSRVQETFPLEQVHQAHKLTAAGRLRGKIVLTF
ncbi:NADP-dependent oxidoreductase [Amycolatopsis rhabdoformis]|uniref:NADP-dependent oxidoreductase n=1 Tax=Amycolatopsis rhabdoformis TaxID=1448059 RepID=A0ABZ1IKC8_9PSEU|nr:NADP-dependent oxidoreductase [Amycolatopsis rhabdoformis]WSE34702.1 NADP-dependent oxidoreductase [Amycolatopsis rhabdoformis]